MTNIDWPEVRLGDVIDIKHGFAFKGEHFADSGDHVVVTPGNFYDEGGFKLKAPEKYYTGLIPPDFVLDPGDLLVVMTEQKRGLLGSAGIIPLKGMFLHNQRLGRVVEKTPDATSKRFLYYSFNSSTVRNQIQATANGAKVRHTSPSRIQDVVIHLPPLQVQRKIATVLATYDELIENNLRRIEILEEMAQAIYREWFVDFRYPGHEADDLVDSPLGPIPDGWVLRNLFDVADVAYGFGFKSALFNPGPEGNRVIRIRDIPKNTTSTFTSEGADVKYRVMDGDVLVGMDGDFHMCVWHDGPAMLNQRVARFRSSIDAPVLWLFHALRPAIRHFDATITGTTVAHLGDRHLRTVELLIPQAPLFMRCREALDPLEALVRNLLRQNSDLRTTRDLLLPKLISGEIDVSDLDIDTTWLAA